MHIAGHDHSFDLRHIQGLGATASHALSAHAGAPLLLGGGFMLTAFGIACTVDSQTADHKEEDPRDKGHLHAPLVPSGELLLHHGHAVSAGCSLSELKAEG